MLRRLKEGEKVQANMSIDSEIKIIGHMLARSKQLSFSEFVELLILEQYLKDMDLLEKRM